MSSLFSVSYFIEVIPKLIKSLPGTLTVVGVALILGLIFAFIATRFRIYGGPVTSRVSSLYISFMRGVPLIALLFLIYFGIPEILLWFGIKCPKNMLMFFVMVGFALNVSGYLAENMRSAYLSVDPGQFEAADSIGMTGFQKFIYVTFPQALVICIPNLGNTIIMLIKDTSLAFTFGVIDIMGRAEIINSRNYGARQVEIYIAVAVIYWFICFVLERVIKIVETRADKSRFRSKGGAA
ncbi:MAG: amino acid ABC transporter permease [Firmicutes bacterium]|nr:amino acid ABC transporter permease [Bacillota bacterium]